MKKTEIPSVVAVSLIFTIAVIIFRIFHFPCMESVPGLASLFYQPAMGKRQVTCFSMDLDVIVALVFS